MGRRRVAVLGLVLAAAVPPAGAQQGDAAGAARGLTLWQIHWQYALRPLADGRCRLVPQPTRLATRQVISADASAALRLHEAGHLAIAQRAARRLDERLARVPDAPCASLRDTAEREAAAVLAEHRELERLHDLPAGVPARP